MGYLFGLVVVVQTILHYLGWLGIVLGIIAIVCGNSARGTELLVGGFSFLVVKYLLGFLFVCVGLRIAGPKTGEDKVE
jgi:hypothetical protein